MGSSKGTVSYLSVSWFPFLCRTHRLVCVWGVLRRIASTGCVAFTYLLHNLRDHWNTCDLFRSVHWFLECNSVLGKVEGKGDMWHGHVTAVTIAPEYRRLGLAKRLMDSLEHVSDNMYANTVSLVLIGLSRMSFACSICTRRVCFVSY